MITAPVTGSDYVSWLGTVNTALTAASSRTPQNANDSADSGIELQKPPNEPPRHATSLQPDVLNGPLGLTTSTLRPLAATPPP